MQRRLSVFRLRALAACWHLDKPLSAATWHAGAPAGARLLPNLRHNWSRRHKKNCTSNFPFVLVQWEVDEPLPTAAIKAPLTAKFEMFHLRLLAPN